MGRRPFLFVASWMTHEDFSELVKRNWTSRVDWNMNISSFTQAVQHWNKCVFGNIAYRKHRLMNRLHGISRSLSQGWNPYLVRLQKHLWTKYEKVLYQEEVLWFQKSRCKWLKYGDKNTRYFHGTTVVRRKRQRVEALQDSAGNWVHDPDCLRNMAIHFFQDLYLDDLSGAPWPIRGCFPKLSSGEFMRLSDNLSRQEVHKALFHMGGLKAPGPDGYQAIFFQHQWEWVGDSVFNLIADIFAHPQKVKEINETLICLIPKIDDPSNIKHFRPISLCNVSYKIVTKVLANRMKG